MNFVHIHLHTDFSCLDGYGTTSEYATKAAQNGVPFLCVTDHGMAAAFPRMIEECHNNNITPIFGCEVYVNNFHHLVPEFSTLSDDMKKKVRKNHHLVLIAKNNQGYENLIKLVSDSWINGFYYKPRVTWELIKEYSEGLTCSSACLGSELSQSVLNGDMDNAYRIASEYKELFKEDYYIELQMIKMKEQDVVNLGLIKIAKDLNIPTVITNDVHYCEKEDSYNHKLQLLINSRGTINSPSDFDFHTEELWYKTEQELDELWKSNYSNNIPYKIYEQSKRNTVVICEQCDVTIDTSPKFPVIENANKKMLQKCLEVLEKKKLRQDIKYMERLGHEYKVITEKEYSSYFMLVKQVIDWAKSEGWSVGPGRGCFLPNNIVQCKKEKKEIKNVEIGDLVLSHTRKYNSVIDKFIYNIDEEVISIKTENDRNISCTSDHKIFIKNKNKYKWIQAQYLEIGNEILDLSSNIDDKIKSISKFKYIGEVYDLKVKNDKSYNIDNLAVHNSGAGSLICYLLGITQVDPIKHDLLFERFLSPSRGGKFAKLQFDKEDEIK